MTIFYRISCNTGIKAAIAKDNNNRYITIFLSFD